MKTLLTITVALLFSSGAMAAKRFTIKNEITGNEFIHEGDALPEQLPNVYGLKSREIECSRVPTEEAARILSRRTTEATDAVPAIELCTLKDQFTVSEQDLTAEVAEKTRKETVRTTRASRVIELAKKFKAGTITAAERNELLGLLTLHLIREFGQDLD